MAQPMGRNPMAPKNPRQRKGLYGWGSWRNPPAQPMAPKSPRLRKGLWTGPNGATHGAQPVEPPSARQAIPTSLRRK